MDKKLTLPKELEACREKYWSEITQKEKIERTRKAVKRLMNEIHNLGMGMERLKKHSHNLEGEAIVVEKIKSYYGGEEDSMPRKEDDNVYF